MRGTKGCRGVLLLEIVFGLLIAFIVASTLAFSSVTTYTGSRTAGKRQEAHQLALLHVDSVLQGPGALTPPFRDSFVDKSLTTVYQGELSVRTVPAHPKLWEATVTLTWTERNLTHTVTRKRLAAAPGS